MLPQLIEQRIAFGSITPPKPDLLAAIHALGLTHAFPPRTGNDPILSLDACLMLLKATPLILNGKEVVAGVRTYWLCKSVVPESTIIDALAIKSRLQRDQILAFGQHHILLTCVANSINKPGPSVYSVARNNPYLEFSNLLTLLRSSQGAIASTLGLTVKTLTRGR